MKWNNGKILRGVAVAAPLFLPGGGYLQKPHFFAVILVGTLKPDILIPGNCFAENTPVFCMILSAENQGQNAARDDFIPNWDILYQIGIF